MEIHTSGMGVLIGMLLLLSRNLYRSQRFNSPAADQISGDETGPSVRAIERDRDGLAHQDADPADNAH